MEYFPISPCKNSVSFSLLQLFQTLKPTKSSKFKFIFMIEQFSVQFRKTKTTVLTKASWSAGRHQSRPVGIQVKNRQISLNLIGWEGGATFWDQSQCEIEQKQSNHELLSTLNWKQLNVHDGIWRIVLQANREKLMRCTSKFSYVRQVKGDFLFWPYR